MREAATMGMRIFIAISIVAIFAIACCIAGIEIANRNDRYDYCLADLSKQIAKVESGETATLYFYDTAYTDQLLRKIDPFLGVCAIEFDMTDVTNNGIKLLARWKHLKQVTVYGGHYSITDLGLQSLAESQTLRRLDLVNTKVTDDGLKLLAQARNLEILTLEWSSTNTGGFTDRAFKSLENVPHLRELRIVGDWASDSAITRFRDRHKNTTVSRIKNYHAPELIEQCDATEFSVMSHSLET
jgi:hypothetical protein